MNKRQAFLVFGFIVTLILSVSFFVQSHIERNKRIAIEKNIASIIEAKKNIEIALNKKVEDALKTVKQKERLIEYLSANLNKERRIRLRLARNLERTNTRVSSGKSPVELEKIVVKSLNEADGKVLAVDKKNDLVVISLGATHNMKTGDRLSIYRGNDFIVNTELVKVQDGISVGMLLSDGKDVGVEVNDAVTSSL